MTCAKERSSNSARIVRWRFSRCSAVIRNHTAPDARTTRLKVESNPSLQIDEIGAWKVMVPPVEEADNVGERTAERGYRQHDERLKPDIRTGEIAHAPRRIVRGDHKVAADAGETGMGKALVDACAQALERDRDGLRVEPMRRAVSSILPRHFAPSALRPDSLR